MARICLVSPGQLERNPRMVRNAECLARAGHEVQVVYPDYQPSFRSYDANMIAGARWQARPLDFCTTPAARMQWQWVRLPHDWHRGRHS